MNVGYNVIGQRGLSNYRVSAQPPKNKPVAATIVWSEIDRIEGQNEIVTITIDATGGTFTISFGGQTTAGLAYDATAATVEAALEGLSTIGNGNVRVTLADSVYTIEFIEDLRHTNVGAVTTNPASLTGGAGTATVAVSQAGAADEDQDLPGGVTAAYGERILRAGTILTKDGDTYRPATDEDTLVRGECFIVDRHYFESVDAPQIGDVFDEGVVYFDRLLIGGSGQVSEADFLDAFPSVRLHRD